MNFQATVSSIAALGGIRPGSHITARPVTAIKAGPVAHSLAGVIEGCSTLRVGYSDLSPSFTLSGSVDRRMSGGKAVLCNATSRSGGGYGLWPATALQQTSPHYRCNLGNPRAEKVWPHRPRQNKGAAPLTKAPSAFRRIGGAVRQGTLTITGSNVRLGTEMPVALSSFSQ